MHSSETKAAKAGLKNQDSNRPLREELERRAYTPNVGSTVLKANPSTGTLWPALHRIARIVTPTKH